MKVEYKIRTVNRYIVTRYYEDGDKSGSKTVGEYDNADIAYEVGYAMARQEHEILGYPLEDERIQYPIHPGSVQVELVELAMP